MTGPRNQMTARFPVTLGVRETAVRVETAVMRSLHEIADESGLSVDGLCTEIALGQDGRSLPSALRIFVVGRYRRQLAQREAEKRGSTLPTSPPGPAWMKRRAIEPGAPSAAPALSRLSQWWRERARGPSRLPRHDAIDPGLMRRLGLDGMVHVVDAGADDPMNYRFRLFARKVKALGALDFEGQRIGDAAGAQYAAAVAEDYFGAATRRGPAMHDIEATVAGVRRAYQRLIVPFSVTSGRADCLLVAIRYTEPPGAACGRA
jgi:predicted DNA-binding ribbon-helix-helix protein